MQAAGRGWARYQQVQGAYAHALQLSFSPPVIKTLMIGYGVLQALSPGAPEILPFAPVHQFSSWVTASMALRLWP